MMQRRQKGRKDKLFRDRRGILRLQKRKTKEMKDKWRRVDEVKSERMMQKRQKGEKQKLLRDRKLKQIWQKRKTDKMKEKGRRVDEMKGETMQKRQKGEKDKFRDRKMK